MKWFSWLFKPAEVEILKPGLCECGHYRCVHTEGKGRCLVDYGKKSPNGGQEIENGYWACACSVYIPKEDDDGGGKTPVPDPELDELRKLIK